MKKIACEPAIEIERLVKSFGTGAAEKKVLKGISLDISKNQIFGLLGPNGAGKTTLIYILSGLLHADGGTAKVLGLDPKNQRKELAKKINICSGNSMFIYSFTPKEILKYYGILYGMNGKDIESNSNRLIADLGITGFADKQFFSLSTGMKQKVALAKSLINDPELLFLDEPTLGLDVEVARNIREYIRNLVKKKNLTIVLTSHYLFEVEELCDNIAVIHNGDIIAKGTVDEIKNTADIGMTVVATLKKTCAPNNISAIRKIAGVRDVKLRERDLVVYLDNKPEHIENLLAFFKKCGMELGDIEVRKATLEEAFLNLIKPKEE